MFSNITPESNSELSFCVYPEIAVFNLKRKFIFNVIACLYYQPLNVTAFLNKFNFSK